eukprot:6999768-Karenia_brevis.AAC.1
MLTEVAEEVAKIGLQFSYRKGKTEIMELLQCDCLPFQVNQETVKAPGDGNLKILNIPLNPFGTLEAELTDRIARLHAAAGGVSAQIYNKKASFISRLGILFSVAASAATWAIEIHAPSGSFLHGLNVAYINICMGMSGRRFGGDGEWGVWVAGVRSHIKKVVRKATGDIIDLALMKHYRFAGHIARNPKSALCIKLACDRGRCFIEGARSNKHHKPAYCRQ